MGNLSLNDSIIQNLPHLLHYPNRCLYNIENELIIIRGDVLNSHIQLKIIKNKIYAINFIAWSAEYIRHYSTNYIGYRHVYAASFNHRGVEGYI